MEIFELIKQLVHSPKVIIELGACDGNETARFINLFPNCNIVALEPVPNLAEIVRNRKEVRSGNVEVIQKAIGKIEGETTLYVSGGTSPINGQSFYASSSIQKPVHAEKVFVGMNFVETKCEVTTLDKIWNDLGRPVIDFIWSDIQASERDMIEGGMEALKHTKYLFTEVKEGDYYQNEISDIEILQLLPDFELVEHFGTDILIKNKNFE